MVDPFSLASAHHDMVSARYSKIKEQHQHVDGIRMEMDQLLRLGDTVSPEDVIKAAGLIVGKGGISSEEMAEMLAGMPSVGGQPLSAWVKQQDQQVRQIEQAIGAQRATIQHHLGVSAVRALAAHHLQTPSAPAAPAAPAQSNALAIESPTPAGLENAP